MRKREDELTAICKGQLLSQGKEPEFYFGSKGKSLENETAEYDLICSLQEEWSGHFGENRL